LRVKRSALDGAGDPSDTLVGRNGIAVGKNAPDEAIDFLRYISTVEAQKGFITPI